MTAQQAGRRSAGSTSSDRTATSTSPRANPLSPYSLTGQWPKTGKGNREGKAPIRYLGRFFYSSGEVEVAVPAGSVRVEVWKGFEYRPVAKSIEIAAGETKPVSIELERTVPMAALGYYSGDPHLHFPRRTEADDQVILDLLEAEDIHFGSILAYNEPAGPVYRHDGDDGRASAPRPGESLDHAAAARPGSPPARSIAAQRMVISIFTGVTTWCSKGRRSTRTTGRSTAC